MALNGTWPGFEAEPLVLSGKVRGADAVFTVELPTPVFSGAHRELLHLRKVPEKLPPIISSLHVHIEEQVSPRAGPGVAPNRSPARAHFSCLLRIMAARPHPVDILCTNPTHAGTVTGRNVLDSSLGRRRGLTGGGSGV